jgi:hypothetical protein
VGITDIEKSSVSGGLYTIWYLEYTILFLI